jgi:hypothetical protein
VLGGDASSYCGDSTLTLYRDGCVWRLEHLDHVIVVDDYSPDQMTTVARAAGAEVIRHSENLGKGAAIKTGLCKVADTQAHLIVGNRMWNATHSGRSDSCLSGMANFHRPMLPTSTLTKELQELLQCDQFRCSFGLSVLRCKGGCIRKWDFSR